MHSLLIALVASMPASPAASAGAAPVGAIDLVEAQACFELALALSERDGGALWGVELYGPLLLADPASRAVVANVPDGEGVLQAEGDVWVGELGETVGVANTAVDWAGRRWTMVVWPLPEHAFGRSRLLMHELFHRVQPLIGHLSKEADTGHLDTLDGRVWLRLELRALERALSTGDPAEQRAAGLDALLFRRKRRAGFDGAAEAEQALEFNEGLAEYTGYRLAETDTGRRRSRAAEAIRDRGGRASFVRSFAHLTGPAYGLLLDEASPGWRGEVGTERPLDSLLAEALREEVVEGLGDQALARAAGYGYDEILVQERSREEERQAWVAAQKGRYVDGPTLTLPMQAPRSSFDPDRVKPLGEAGSVYGSIEVRDAWGVLRAEGGALWTKEFTLRVPAPRETGGSEVAGDGWVLRLAEGWGLGAGERDGDYVLVAPQSQ